MSPAPPCSCASRLLCSFTTREVRPSRSQAAESGWPFSVNSYRQLGSTFTLALMGGSLIYLKLLMCGASLRLDKDESSIPPCDPQSAVLL